MSTIETRLIDQITLELLDKNLLGDVAGLNLTREALDELKADYEEEFEAELREVRRKVSVKDLEDHFNLPLVVSALPNGKKYQLLSKI